MGRTGTKSPSSQSTMEKRSLQKFRMWYKNYIATNLDFLRNATNKTSGDLSTWKFSFLFHSLTKFYLLLTELRAKASKREKNRKPIFSRLVEDLWLMVNLTPQKTVFDMGQWQESCLGVVECFHRILLENALS